MAGLGLVWLCTVRLGSVRQGMEWRGEAGISFQGMVRFGMAGLG